MAFDHDRFLDRETLKTWTALPAGCRGFLRFYSSCRRSSISLTDWLTAKIVRGISRERETDPLYVCTIIKRNNDDFIRTRPRFRACVKTFNHPLPCQCHATRTQCAQQTSNHDKSAPDAHVRDDVKRKNELKKKKKEVTVCSWIIHEAPVSSLERNAEAQRPCRNEREKERRQNDHWRGWIYILCARCCSRSQD